MHSIEVKKPIDRDGHWPSKSSQKTIKSMQLGFHGPGPWPDLVTFDAND